MEVAGAGRRAPGSKSQGLAPGPLAPRVTSSALVDLASSLDATPVGLEVGGLTW